MRPKLVIFDCDGVIVDSEKLTNAVMRDNLAGYGLNLSIAQIMDLFVGGTMQGVMELARDMGAELPEAWLDEIYGEMFVALSRDVELVAGVDTVLDRLDAAGIPYAIGSNGPHAKMDITLTKTAIKARFEGRIYSREDVAAPKPAPDVYLKASQDAGVAPADCVVIEDSASGARAAVAAKMRCFGFHADTPRKKLTPHCDALFARMSDLPDLLGV
ncbi:HAD family phosphatase [Ascidiaceihabitans sp.]|uniref:HAD family hydrolase n=1 Tax=Ascidiaceihabitans sp. TaxID=1872644 RepID=UPI0032998548